MPLRRLGISIEVEVTIIVALLMVTMFTCTEILAKKLDKINQVHVEQLEFLKDMQLSNKSQSEINEKLAGRLQNIENELKVLQSNQADTLISLRKKRSSE